MFALRVVGNPSTQMNPPARRGDHMTISQIDSVYRSQNWIGSNIFESKVVVFALL